MQSQQVRDDKTLAIVTSLGRGLLVLVVGGLVLWGVDALTGLADQTAGVLTGLIILCAVAVVVARLARVGRSGSTR
jgi:type III secretory pathway component EscS